MRLTPRSGRDALDGTAILAEGQAVLRARVRATPTKGAANAALEALLASTLGVPKSAVAVVAGGTGRLKTVRVAGDAASLLAALATHELG